MAEITINSGQLKESDGTFAKVPKQAARLLAAVEPICSQRRNNPVAFPLEAKPLRMLHCKI
jgi:hypothetical protein